ncbi:MAG: hypothetical protein V1838_05060 [Patescibacteria group bacterium]
MNEPVNVVVSFNGAKVKPLAFQRQGREYQIDKVNLAYTNQEEGVKVYYFAVSDQGNYYSLCFNPMTLQWRLREIYWE